MCWCILRALADLASRATPAQAVTLTTRVQLGRRSHDDQVLPRVEEPQQGLQGPGGGPPSALQEHLRDRPGHQGYEPEHGEAVLAGCLREEEALVLVLSI